MHKLVHVPRLNGVELWGFTRKRGLTVFREAGNMPGIDALSDGRLTEMIQFGPMSLRVDSL
jgi:hypothetical protein